MGPGKIKDYVEHAVNDLKEAMDKSGRSIQGAMRSIEHSGKEMWKTKDEVIKSTTEVASAFADFASSMMLKTINTVFSKDKQSH